MHTLFKDLVTFGANIEVVMNNGNSVLHIAISRKQLEIVEYIVQNYKGKSLFAANRKGQTPLHIAVLTGNAKIVKLVMHEVDINCKDNENGSNALHLSVENDEAYITSLLIPNTDSTSKNWSDGYTALHIACRKGYVQILKMLIANGANIHEKDYDMLTPVQIATKYCMVEVLQFIATEVDENILQLKSDNNETLLHLAVKFGDFENVPNKIVEYLLSQNVFPIDEVDSKGNSALHYACLTFMVDIVTMLVEHGANIHLKNKTGNNPFHFAARTGSIDIINYLLEKGGNPNIKNKRGNNVNHISIAHGRINPAICLLERGADLFSKNKKGNCIIHQSAASGGTILLDYIIENFGTADFNVVNVKKQTALSVAIKVDINTTDIKKLIKIQKDINSQDMFGNTVLHVACRYGSTGFVEQLLNRGADVNIKNNYGDTALHIACRQEYYLTYIQLLMAKYNDFACVNKLGYNVLHCAATNKINIVQLLFNKVDKHGKTNNGDTILHIACRNKDVQVCRWLLHNCSEIINERNNAGESVLLSCLKFPHIDLPLLDLMLQHGANITATNCNGDNALHVAASLARPDFVAYFLQHRLDVNARNMQHNTSLHLAAHNGYLDVVKLLVAANCDVNAVNVELQSALHSAAKAGRTSVVKYLVQEARSNTELVDCDANTAALLAHKFEQMNMK